MSNTRKLGMTVSVSHSQSGYNFVFTPDQHVDEQGTITVKGKKDEVVVLEFLAEEGNGIEEVEFLEDPTDSIVVGDAGVTGCPPPPGTEFDEPGHVGGNRRKLKIRDKKNKAGKFCYALWFRVVRSDGTVDTAFFDPMIINNFDEP